MKVMMKDEYVSRMKLGLSVKGNRRNAGENKSEEERSERQLIGTTV